MDVCGAPVGKTPFSDSGDCAALLTGDAVPTG
jgi:hypothetical protein